jgi:hypothetical protein
LRYCWKENGSLADKFQTCPELTGYKFIGTIVPSPSMDAIMLDDRRTNSGSRKPTDRTAGRRGTENRSERRSTLMCGIIAGFVGCLFGTAASPVTRAAIVRLFSGYQLLATPAYADGRGGRHGWQQGDQGNQGDQQGSDHQSGGQDQQNGQWGQWQDGSQQRQDDGGSNDNNNNNSNNNDNANWSNSQPDGSTGWGGHYDSGDGQDHGNAKSSQSNNGDATSKRQFNDGASKPPATVERWLKQLFKEAPGPTDQAKKDEAAQDGAKPHDTKPEGTKQDGSKQDGSKQDGSKQDVPKRAFVAHTPPAGAFPEISAPVILAVNANSTTLEKAQALGFRVTRPTSLSTLDLSVTPLLPPEGMDAAAAQSLLTQELPAARFGINQKYRIYRTATGTRPDQPNASAAAQRAGNSACGTDHCFGRSLIGWKPESGSCTSGVRVGIIDTSIDINHPAFSHKILEVRHLGPNGAPGPDWHGTGVTALLAGDSSSGTPGLIPNSLFVIADIFQADVDGQPASDTFSMLRALDWLEAKNVNIVNMRLSGPQDDLVHRAIEKLSARGVLFVAAAGNDGPAAGPSYPAAYENVIAVTAVGKDLQSYRYANRGNYIDIAAPGVSIWTALPGSKEGYHSGTSYATPYVTAALAAIYSRHAVKSKAEALKQLAFKDLGAPGRDPVYGEGLLLAPAVCGANQIARSTNSSAQAVDGVSLAESPSPPAAELHPWLTFQSNN